LKAAHPRGDKLFARGLRFAMAFGGFAAAAFAVVAFLNTLVRGWIS